VPDTQTRRRGAYREGPPFPRHRGSPGPARGGPPDGTDGLRSGPAPGGTTQAMKGWWQWALTDAPANDLPGAGTHRNGAPIATVLGTEAEDQKWWVRGG